MWHLIDDPDDPEMRYYVICDETYKTSIDWSPNTADVFNSRMCQESAQFCNRILREFKTAYSADTLDELKLIIMLEG